MFSRSTVEFYLWLFIRISVVAFILQKWRNIKFYQSFVAIFAWFHWNTVGITLFAMYVVHLVIASIQQRKVYASLGRIVGGGLGFSEDGHLSHLTKCADKSQNDKEKEKLTQLKIANRFKIETNEKKMQKRKRKKSQTKKPSSKNEISNHVCVVVEPQKLPPWSSSKDHPGLSDFHLWMGAMSDIYRVYEIGTIGQESPLPYLPRSESGRVGLELNISNFTTEAIDIYWVNYKGKETLRGNLRPYRDNVTHITTWVGHPWTFRRSSNQQLLFHFVPLRVAPITFDEARSNEILGRDTSRGHFTFAIHEPDLLNDSNACSIHDDALPHPPSKIQSINHALEFACQQMERENINPSILLKYLRNIALNPSDSKYRQIRTGNKLFWNNIWINSGRGILHALGFEENGPFVEMGPELGPLPRDRLKHLANSIVMLEELAHDMEHGQRNLDHQPVGANGYVGRAGFRI
jgi:hypothetical protein